MAFGVLSPVKRYIINYDKHFDFRTFYAFSRYTRPVTTARCARSLERRTVSFARQSVMRRNASFKRGLLETAFYLITILETYLKARREFNYLERTTFDF